MPTVCSVCYLVQQVKQLVQQQPHPSVSECTLCWILEESIRPETPRKIEPQQAAKTLSEVQADLSGVNLQVETQILEGHSITNIFEAARTANVSAIAISSGTIGKFQEWLVSSFAGELLRYSWFPVLFFPNRI